MSKSFRHSVFWGLLLTLIFSNTNVNAQVGALTFGAVLDNFADKLGGLIDKAANAGEVVEMGAGAQIVTAIANAKKAYADSLNLTQDRWNDQQTKIFNDLTTEIGYLQNHVIDQLQKIADQGSMIANDIPLSKTFPQLGWFTPSYMMPISDDTSIELHGNFFDAARSGYTPSLNIGGKTYNPTMNSTLGLGFVIPANMFSGESIYTAKSNVLTRINAELTVPYRESHFLVFNTKKEASFNFQIIRLPQNAGSIEFTTTHAEMKTVRQPNQSGEFIQSSDNDDIPDPIGNGHVNIASPTAGWNVDPATVSIQFTHTEGDYTDFGNRSTVANAAWSIGTRHHGMGTSGKVHFILHWTEYQDQLVNLLNTTNVDLTWQSSKTFTVPTSGTWSAKYHQFNGSSFDIGSAQFNNPYIKVETSGNNVTFVTPPF